MERSTSLEYALCRHRRERVAGAANWPWGSVTLLARECACQVNLCCWTARFFEAEVDLRAISEYTSAFWEHRMAPFS